jgi:purine nucleoside permease
VITWQELADALAAYARDTQADVHPADHPAIAALLHRLPERPDQFPYGVQIGDRNVQANYWNGS